MDWNDEAIARLRQLWQDGHSTAEIGRRMGITKNAVVGKAHRLALVPRPSPIRWATEADEATRRPSARRAMESTVRDLDATQGPRRAPADILAEPVAANPAVAAVPVPRPVLVEVAAAPVAVAVPPVRVPARAAVQLRAVPLPRASARVSTCCWPIGEPGTKSFRFCDADASSGKPYCAEHAQIAYVKVRDRREEAA